MSEKEKRVRAITKIYYSNPQVRDVLFKFSKDREVVPSYMMQAFGKRPDTIQYPSDIMNLVNKGATSFHASEEIWINPLEINSDMSQKDLDLLRKTWDLLIDIDSPYLDCSKIAAKLIIKELEKQGIKNYGLKFSGSKGFHIIVPGKAFPDYFQEVETKLMFPEWPRAISEYLMYKIKAEYNKEITKLNINFEALQERTKLTKEDVTEIPCPNCGEKAEKRNLVFLRCNRCENLYQKPSYKITKRKLRCNEETCPGFYEVINEEEHFFCDKCKTSSLNKTYKSDKKVTYTKEARSSQETGEFREEISAEKIASLDLVLVAPRHLFRMPYSLHEKTALASIVLTKEQISSFNPRDANPLNVKIKEFYPDAEKGEASDLLESAVLWKMEKDGKEEQSLEKKYSNYKKIDIKDVTEDMFPQPIKKLLKGLEEGKKRGLFILLTFLKSLNFSAEYINSRAREWNKLNSPPLKEGYIKSQIDWILKQKKQILPPNYKNENFYKDLNLIESGKEPKEKNPIVEVLRKVRKRN
ncbi:MAG: hypothetical protein Q8P57_05070 [Candidatus Pacearchaeota archaeon]|nr:hypothetical protein [Candidatus Pacearchaeota archaeon]